MIKISLRDIASKGVDVDQAVLMESIGLSREEADIRSPLHVKARVERAENMVVAETWVDAEFGYTCARCLEEFKQKEHRVYTFDIEISPEMEEVDLGEEIRQEIILTAPSKVLCRPDCKGICSGCGANLNVEQCQCKK